MKPSSVSNLCRTCLKQNGSLKSIFTIYEGSKFLNTFADIINVYITSLVNITKGDGFPDMICPSCSQKVLEFYEFKTNIENNEQILKSQSPIINFWVKEEKLDSDENFQESDVNCDKTDDSISTLAEATMVDVNKGDECAIKQEKENEEKNEYKIVNVEDLTNNFQDNLNKIIKNGQDSLVMQEMLNHEVKIEDLEENECEMLSIDNTRTSLESDEDDPMQEDVNEASDSDDDLAEKTENGLPKISKHRYESAFRKFMEWRNAEKIESLSEDVLLSYFDELTKTLKPNTLWAQYSMLRQTMINNCDVDISKYHKLRAILKCKSKAYKPKKLKTLTMQEVNKFIKKAPDETYLFTKVALIIGVNGACRKKELCQLKTSDIEDLGSAVLIKINDTKRKRIRTCTLTGDDYKLFKKYAELRPSNVNEQRFFVNYKNNKCTRCVVGLNKFGSILKEVACYLKLENPELYTGHCYRRLQQQY